MVRCADREISLLGQRFNWGGDTGMLQNVSKIGYNSATYPDPQTLLFRGKKSKEGDADFWAVRGKRDPPHHEAAGAAPLGHVVAVSAEQGRPRSRVAGDFVKYA